MFEYGAAFAGVIFPYIPFLIAGIVCSTLYFYLFWRSGKAKYWADLLWISLGGVGAVSVLLLSQYSDQKEQLDNLDIRVLEMAAEAGEKISDLTDLHCVKAAAQMPNRYNDPDINAKYCASLVGELAFLLSDRSLVGIVEVKSPKVAEITSDEKSRSLCGYMNDLVRLRDCETLSKFYSGSLNDIDKANFGWTVPEPADGEIYGSYHSAAYMLAELGALLNFRNSKFDEVKSSEQFLILRYWALGAFFFVFPFRIGKSAVDISRS